MILILTSPLATLLADHCPRDSSDDEDSSEEESKDNNSITSDSEFWQRIEDKIE